MGYLNPFTLEAQVNTRQPKLRVLTTAAHEIASAGLCSRRGGKLYCNRRSNKIRHAYMQYAAIILLWDMRFQNVEREKILITNNSIKTSIKVS
ncbi:MAG: hypothetical protein CM15mP32_1790 [Flavobacteriaceae bacterium]|nr:MAG: hypothetical protein CM15mP32_1790 [Flavobacteriaceae bacterium]